MSAFPGLQTYRVGVGKDRFGSGFAVQWALRQHTMMRQCMRRETAKSSRSRLLVDRKVGEQSSHSRGPSCGKSRLLDQVRGNATVADAEHMVQDGRASGKQETVPASKTL